MTICRESLLKALFTIAYLKWKKILMQIPHTQHHAAILNGSNRTPELRKVGRFINVFATINTFSKDYRVLPLYEKKLFDHIRIRHYSLRVNKLLACRWKCTVDCSKRQREPFQIPSVDDFHFYNYHNRYAPSQSITVNGRHRKKLAAGPGFDEFGEMPIPYDMHLRKSDMSGRPAILKRKTAILKRKKF